MNLTNLTLGSSLKSKTIQPIILRRTGLLFQSITIRPKSFKALIYRGIHSTNLFKMPQYRLIGVDKSDLKPTFKREVAVEGLDDTKLLLVQVGDNVTALSPRCT